MLKPPSCSGCPLESLGDGFSKPDGLGTSGVAIIGEALGYEEFLDGLPFRPTAAAGSKLEQIIRLASEQTGRPISRNQFKLWNVLACKPPGNELVGRPYEQRAIDHCRTHFNNVIGNTGGFQPRVLLALGNTPLKYLTGVSGIHDEKQSISYLRGYVFNSKYGLVIPSYHPAFLKRGNNHLTPLVVEDLIRALDVARGVYSSYSLHSSYKPPSYQLTPGLDEAWSFYYKVRDNPKLVLTFDIETGDNSSVDEDERDELENADITLVQFSIGRNTGIAFPYQGDYIQIIIALFALPNVKANHNTYNFDNPRLQAKGILINGRVHDTMWMFKHWHSSLPRGLQSVASMFGFPFPWKHLYSSNLNFYGCADVDAVQWILHFLPQLMKQRGVWQGYLNHVVGMHTILDRGRNVGIPVNETKRIEITNQFIDIKKDLHTKLQKIIPDDIRDIKPKRKCKETGTTDYGYIREPKQVSQALEYYNTLVETINKSGRSKPENVISFQDFLYRKYGLAYATFGTDISDVETDGSGTTNHTSRWCIIKHFTGTSQQLIRYLKWKQKEITKAIEIKFQERQEVGGRDTRLTKEINELRELLDSYKIPKNFKTKKDTTGKKEIEELYYKNGDPVLEMVMQIRSLDTNLTNYIPNWKPSSDGRVHTTFGFTAPTGQLDSRRPNILNCSKHTTFGNIFRGMIEAPEGYTFIECDKKSFHVGTMGYVANDETYIKFSQTDPHSILGSYIDPSIIGTSIDLHWSESDIIAAAGEFKKRSKELGKREHGIDVRQQMAKPTVLGNQLGLGAKKLQRQNRRFIQTVEQAERLQEIISNLFPKVELAKKQIKDQAHNQHYLMNEFGFIQYFYDVYQFKWNKNGRCWDRKEGDGARHPIAFKVQGCAFGMIQEEFLELERLGLNEKYNWVNAIHDSGIWMPKVGDVDRAIADIAGIMNRPCKKLTNQATGENGLVIKVDVSVGRNWKAWDKDSNPEGMREVYY